MTSTKKSFVRGAAILGITSFLVKLIGVLYGIPLNKILGAGGAGVYGAAYPFYTYLLMLSTAGLPPTIAKLVAESVSKGDHAGARKIFRISLLLMAGLGLLFSTVLFVFAKPIAINYAQDPLAQMPIMAIAPAIFFVSIMASIRGYFQGLQNMIPTAVSQIVEQVIKIMFGITLAVLLTPKGIEYGAMGAMIGISISELLGLFVVIGFYIKKAPKIDKSIKSDKSAKSIVKNILSIAFPILLGASIMPLVLMIDTNLIKVRLQSIGYTLDASRELFGLFTQFVNKVINVPGSISLAFCVSMVPAAAAAVAKGDNNLLKSNIFLGYKMSMMVALPSAVGLFILAGPIMDLLYRSDFVANPQYFIITTNLLRIMSGGIVFLSILQTFNGLLQGMGKVYVPVISLSIGAITKIVLCYVLVGTPFFNIYGAPISTFACYMVAAIIDIVIVKKLTKVKLSQNKFNIKLILTTALMGAAAWGSHILFSGLWGSRPATIVAVFIGVIVFVFGLLIFKVLSKDEMRSIPGGTRLIKLYDLIWER